jgi:hypothetical protein
VRRALLEGAEFDSFESADAACVALTQGGGDRAPITDLPESVEVLQKSPIQQARPQWSQKRFFLVMGSYCLIAAASIYPSLLHGPARLVQAHGEGDVAQQLWFLEYAPWAVLHGHNPFITTWINAPNGANLLGNTGIFLPSMLASPITLLFGPVAGFNFWTVLGFTLSAGSMYFAVSHWVRWRPAAYIAGLAYGFSPFMAGQGVSHLNLLIQPVPPLVLYVAYEMLVGRRNERTRRLGILLGLLLAAQFFISTEILGAIGMMGVFGTAAALLFDRDRVIARAKTIAATTATAFLTFIVICFVPLILLFEGTDHYVGPAQSVLGLDQLRSDLFSVINPTSLQLIDPFALKTPFGDATEAGLYLGLPLLVFLAATCWKMRSSRMVRCLSVLAFAAWVLDLGPRLTVAGQVTSIPLPFAVIAHLPLLDNLVPSRLSLFVFLFAVPIMALGLDRLHSAVRGETGSASKAVVLVSVVAALALFPLIPNWPYASGAVTMPSFFTSTAEQSIPQGSTVITYPFPTGETAWPMSWQAIDGMRYKLVGGYIITPESNGTATFFGSDSDISGLSYYAFNGGQSLPQLSPSVRRGIRLDLEVYGVSTVIVADWGDDPGYMRRAYAAALGEPGRNFNGTFVWFGVKQRLAELNAARAA